MSPKKLMYALPLAVAFSIAGLALRRAAQAAPIAPAPSVTQDSYRLMCYHTDPSDWVCPDTTGRLFTLTSATIKSASLTITDSAGRTQTVAFPARTDAVFLSANAMRNFLVRHYQATNRRKAREVTAFIAAHVRATTR